MKLIPDNIRSLLARAWPSLAAVPKQRRFEGARMSRLERDWSVVQTSTNSELRSSLRVLRSRSRDLARNDPTIKRFLSRVRTNVAGPDGFKLQARARDASGQLDQPLNRIVAAAWEQWSYPENASVNGKSSWRDICRSWCTRLARDGEPLIQMVLADNPFGFALKFWCPSWLDESYNQLLRNGNRVIMSVELDPDDKPVAYYLTPPPTDYQFRDHTIRKRTRIDASEILHDFLRDSGHEDSDSQTRGVPWPHAVMLLIKMLGGYAEAEVAAARAGASKFASIERTVAEGEWTGDPDAAEQRASVDSMQPGQIIELDPGEKFNLIDPTHPTTAYGDFTRHVKRDFASGLDQAYFALFNDLSDVNYSSARIGLLDERDSWRALQNFEIDHLCRPVFKAWLISAVMTGALSLNADQIRRVIEGTYFQPRGWKWIDPQKEIQANILAINNALGTRTDTVEEQGGDWQEILSILKQEKEDAAAAGIELSPKTEAKPASQQDDDTDGDDAIASKKKQKKDG
jgi:lambda family phage portal protein